jgi:hypothetical protein
MLDFPRHVVQCHIWHILGVGHAHHTALHAPLCMCTVRSIIVWAERCRKISVKTQTFQSNFQKIHNHCLPRCTLSNWISLVE